RAVLPSTFRRYIGASELAPPKRFQNRLTKDNKMRSLKLALLATAAVATLSSAAAAADLIVDVPIDTPIIDNSFSFDGAYVGAFLQGQTNPNAFGLGVNFGVNALMDSLLIGAEIEGVASI